MTTKPKTLAQLRSSIESLKIEIAEVAAAGLPAEECERELARVLDQAQAAHRRMIESAAAALATGELPTFGMLTDYASNRTGTLIEFAIGMAVAAHGTDALVAAAKTEAKKLQGASMRLPAAEKQQRLDDLRRELFLLEQDEEALIEVHGGERRHDCNVAAALGIPIDAAEEFDLLGAK